MISPAVSALADAALLLPASGLVLLYLAALRQGRLLLAFAASLAAAGIVTIVLKLVFHACGHAITDVHVTSPSGHVAFGTAFYGALALMLASNWSRGARIAVAAAVLVLLLAVGISRVRVGAHSPAEVLIGYLVGGASLLLFAWLRRWAGRPRLPWIPVAIGFAGAMLLLFGSHFSLEPRIAGMARGWADTLDICAPPRQGRWRRFSSVRH